eukprot:gene13105-biopygen1968
MNSCEWGARLWELAPGPPEGGAAGAAKEKKNEGNYRGNTTNSRRRSHANPPPPAKAKQLRAIKRSPKGRENCMPAREAPGNGKCPPPPQILGIRPTWYTFELCCRGAPAAAVCAPLWCLLCRRGRGGGAPPWPGLTAGQMPREPRSPEPRAPHSPQAPHHPNETSPMARAWVTFGLGVPFGAKEISRMSRWPAGHDPARLFGKIGVSIFSKMAIPCLPCVPNCTGAGAAALPPTPGGALPPWPQGSRPPPPPRPPKVWRMHAQGGTTRPSLFRTWRKGGVGGGVSGPDTGGGGGGSAGGTPPSGSSQFSDPLYGTPCTGLRRAGCVPARAAKARAAPAPLKPNEWPVARAAPAPACGPTPRGRGGGAASPLPPLMGWEARHIPSSTRRKHRRRRTGDGAGDLFRSVWGRGGGGGEAALGRGRRPPPPRRSDRRTGASPRGGVCGARPAPQLLGRPAAGRPAAGRPSSWAPQQLGAPAAGRPSSWVPSVASHPPHRRRRRSWHGTRCRSRSSSCGACDQTPPAQKRWERQRRAPRRTCRAPRAAAFGEPARARSLFPPPAADWSRWDPGGVFSEFWMEPAHDPGTPGNLDQVLPPPPH